MAKRRGRIIFGLVALALVGAVAYRLAHRTKPAHGGGATAIPVEVAKATRQNVPVYLDALGTVVAYHTVTVQPMITGPLTRILFTPGQFVKKGDLLAEIDPAPYRATLDQAEAKLAQDKASLANAEMQARQYASLVKQNYTSKLQAATALATAAEDRALVKQDEASIETDRINLGYTRITAPISGRTGILQVNAGNIVSPSTTSGIVVINTLQPISVQFSLPQQDLPAIIAAMKRGKVDLLATEEGDPQTAKVLDHGTLAVLDNTVNANTGTLTLKGTFANPDLTLWPGAYVNVRTLVRTIDNAVTVPPVAVQQGPSGSFVFLVKPPAKKGGSFTVIDQKVTLGVQTARVVVVTSGLVPGDEAVTEGNSRLKGGSAIHIVTGSAGAP
ncbi:MULTISPECIES: efflux RND transporter periplasmic adaptor subunit [Acidiphilium]|uniref:HlyD family secretion protein n=1 Tax=Acidiphilium multivorum (strain DSM 11245 / JCM 8867 / NBRC 100883 / AIU 301) TaxID=926570 RepID=F0J1C5_ACIMA|nr:MULTISPECIES: efflux RND transporter periplasmic adaptor subunit [Acidiphilium]MBS3023699.1 efflux RND transporter periplasmic adaptor subunit [Acidiphilium multivorum]MBU6356308.1 efflux RND transporter periplasmic adaptor subunit [Rhodospirillales bacterium]BAJ79507.1 HlyD family secretion protein [Acidiphilium multivorum AIU301]GAN72477.1 multidrug resistance efflux pump acriflavin resistance protein HlyD/AcrB/AcrD/AcrF [Acidiphilium multivorum AIU301]